MKFNDFVQEYSLENKTTSNIKIYEILKKTRLDSKVGIYLRKGDFSTKYGLVNLLLSRGTHCSCYMNDCYFDSFGCSLPKKFLKNLKNKHRNCICSNIRLKRMIVIVQVTVHI